MSDTNPRFFSPEENELAIFAKRYQSLPPGERETFQVEYDKPRPGILQVVLSWLMNAFCWGRGHS